MYLSPREAWPVDSDPVPAGAPSKVSSLQTGLCPIPFARSFAGSTAEALRAVPRLHGIAEIKAHARSVGLAPGFASPSPAQRTGRAVTEPPNHATCQSAQRRAAQSADSKPRRPR